MHGVDTDLQPRKRTSSFVYTASANMQNGISESTTHTPKILKHDTNFLMAISKTFIDAESSLRGAGQANIRTTKLKMRRPN
jgi:hypothetical protein